MDPEQVRRSEDGTMRCGECGFVYNLEPEAVASEAEAGLAAVEAALQHVPESRRTVRPGPSVWSVNGYVAHLSQAARVINSRINAIAERDRPLLPYHDQDAAVEEIGGDARPAQDSLSVLRPAVAAFVTTIRRLPAEAWERTGMHAAGEVRLSDIAHDMPHELQHHAHDISRVGSAVRDSEDEG